MCFGTCRPTCWWRRSPFSSAPSPWSPSLVEPLDFFSDSPLWLFGIAWRLWPSRSPNSLQSRDLVIKATLQTNWEPSEMVSSHRVRVVTRLTKHLFNQYMCVFSDSTYLVNMTQCANYFPNQRFPVNILSQQFKLIISQVFYS